MYSNKLSVQLIGEVLYRYGITNIILSPGSRNAPLTIHFTNHQEYTCYSIVDERSAAFFALGMAQSKKKPVAICCTSGTASANYYPAIIEAFYQNIPIVVLTADRPENYVDIFDGQTIRQKNMYSNHIYGSYQLSESESEESITQNFLDLKKALNTCVLRSGPIHINIPFSEPLYEQTDQIEISFEKLTLPEKNYNSDKYKPLFSTWNNFSKKMILVGMQQPSSKLNQLLEKLAEREDTIILTEVTSNLNSSKFYPNVDRYMFPFGEETLDDYKPELLLTIGQNIVSKKIKDFLRKSKLKAHWHLDEYWHPDTYFSLTEKIEENPVIFLKELVKVPPVASSYSLLWKQLKEERQLRHNDFIKNLPFSDLRVINTLDEKIPDSYNLQISNSSMIRYAQLFNFNSKNKIFCNRGASGIDGATSTAVGFAVADTHPTLLITGDIGFFYDSNALWNKYIPNTFRIILVNNGGGDIFKIIPGPDSSNSLEEYFVTRHNRTARLMAQEYNFEYIQAHNQEELLKELDSFFLCSEKPKLLEINTINQPNSRILREYFNYLNQD
ncbi:2-succinyl-5-enolpyruvyl-6-hydroxy-3-cyclohexene-1-carboxylic-acid synthase [Apibacter sp. B3706]|uniref:2-succinyl-5-enolpyruvyl-6-hydroxy-3- cyclohexene-1-carboxylic-acid synthase n=1 Tax=Apibacter sp. B3706 TaxID=2656760 RepID=UPI00140728AC|nr:2-succinyl-5-enolpyruvyl-6-hydroxy-3-cyclohexene-1-carboxylic-acid synthase [Apibacter sp. B3706]QII70543.1 2-succinyl-5-enolpyruvyl-6-hydroxy-3-cyclohexene-1-carboxylic-acid synthase [Apibacter sp. B3706]